MSGTPFVRTPSSRSPTSGSDLPSGLSGHPGWDPIRQAVCAWPNNGRKMLPPVPRVSSSVSKDKQILPLRTHNLPSPPSKPNQKRRSWTTRVLTRTGWDPLGFSEVRDNDSGHIPTPPPTGPVCTFVLKGVCPSERTGNFGRGKGLVIISTKNRICK